MSLESLNPPEHRASSTARPIGPFIRGLLSAVFMAVALIVGSPRALAQGSEYGVTAAGTSQSTATALAAITSATAHVVTSVATGQGVKLPACAAGSGGVSGSGVVEQVYNTTSTQLALYPGTGDQINALGANNPILEYPGSRVPDHPLPVLDDAVSWISYRAAAFDDQCPIDSADWDVFALLRTDFFGRFGRGLAISIEWMHLHRAIRSHMDGQFWNISVYRCTHALPGSGRGRLWPESQRDHPGSDGMMT